MSSPTGPRTLMNTLAYRTPLFPSQIGIHGDTFNETESPNIFSERVSSATKGRKLSGAQLGSRCASLDASQKILVQQPWEDPSLSRGSAGLFDVFLGGDKAFSIKGHSKTPSTNYRQNGMAGIHPGAYGRFGYRAVSGHEPWKTDARITQLDGTIGPWLVLPRTPGVVRRMDRMRREVKTLQRTVPRLKNPESWRDYTPEKVLSGGGRSTEFLVVFNLKRPLISNSSPSVYSLGDDDSVHTMPSGMSGKHSNVTGSHGEGVSPWSGMPLPHRSWHASMSMSASQKNVGSHHKVENDGETAYMGLIEFNKLWVRLKEDVFKPKLDAECRKVEAFVVEHRRRQAEAAHLAVVQKERELELLEKLRSRVLMEQMEADEAVKRAEKERIEFERSLQVFETEKTTLERIMAEAEKDGVVDEHEADVIARWKFEVQVAQARLRKERAEYERWAARAHKEIEEAEAMTEKCRREASQREAAEAKIKEQMHHSERLGPAGNRAEAFVSVLDRIELYALEKHEKLPHMEFCADGETWIARASLPDGSGYRGQWASGRPEGSGVESMVDWGSQYLGQFHADVRHGHGALTLLKSNLAYAGSWQHGIREGQGVVCHMKPDGSAVPVAFCVCKENKAVHVERFNVENKTHTKIVMLVRKEVYAGLKAADKAKMMDAMDKQSILMHDPTLSKTVNPIQRVGFGRSGTSSGSRKASIGSESGLSDVSRPSSANWREAESQSELRDEDPECFEFLEWARNSAHDGECAKKLSEKASKEAERIQSMENFVQSPEFESHKRDDDKEGKIKFKALISLAQMLSGNHPSSPLGGSRRGSLRGCGSPIPLQLEEPITSPDSTGNMSPISRKNSSGTPTSKLPQKRLLNPLMRLLMGTNQHKNKSSFESDYPEEASTRTSSVASWQAAGFKVVSKNLAQRMGSSARLLPSLSVANIATMKLNEMRTESIAAMLRTESSTEGDVEPLGSLCNTSRSRESLSPLGSLRRLSRSSSESGMSRPSLGGDVLADVEEHTAQNVDDNDTRSGQSSAELESPLLHHNASLNVREQEADTKPAVAVFGTAGGRAKRRPF